MKGYKIAVLSMVVLLAAITPARADDDATAVLDKAIEAAGGEKALDKPAYSWKAKGKLSFGGTESEFTGQTVVEGTDKMRGEFDGEFAGAKVHGVTVINGDKGWRSFGGMTMALTDDNLATEKRRLYLQLGPALLLPLKGKGFELKLLSESKVGEKPAAVIKVTGPDGKDCRIYFDKETGLPVRLTAKVPGFMGEEISQDTTFEAYKDFDGIKKATKIEIKNDGTTFMVQEITEFKALDEAPADSFNELK